MANAKFNYGFEYLGVQDKLVQTPLTDRCYLTMTQALEGRLGGSPFGKNGGIYHDFARILRRDAKRGEPSLKFLHLLCKLINSS